MVPCEILPASFSWWVFCLFSFCLFFFLHALGYEGGRMVNVTAFTWSAHSLENEMLDRTKRQKLASRRHLCYQNLAFLEPEARSNLVLLRLDQHKSPKPCAQHKHPHRTSCTPQDRVCFQQPDLHTWKLKSML